MLQFKNMFNKSKILLNNKGFTLIELLVVIAIIGTLSTVVLASLNSARTKAKNAAANIEFNQIEKAVQMDYNDYGNYAPDVGSGVNPRFIPLYLKKYDASYYCSGCLYDYENWSSGSNTCILIDIRSSGSIVRMHSIDNSGCPTYTDF